MFFLVPFYTLNERLPKVVSLLKSALKDKAQKSHNTANFGQELLSGIINWTLFPQ